jgi:hypothetical protein
LERQPPTSDRTPDFIEHGPLRAGGTLGAAWLTAMPLLDASGIKDPWYALIMIMMALAVFIPMVQFLKRRRRSGG